MCHVFPATVELFFCLSGTNVTLSNLTIKNCTMESAVKIELDSLRNVDSRNQPRDLRKILSGDHSKQEGTSRDLHR